jgi:hypothetical protein
MTACRGTLVVGLEVPYPYRPFGNRRASGCTCRAGDHQNSRRQTRLIAMAIESLDSSFGRNKQWREPRRPRFSPGFAPHSITHVADSFARFRFAPPGCSFNIPSAVTSRTGPCLPAAAPIYPDRSAALASHPSRSSCPTLADKGFRSSTTVGNSPRVRAGSVRARGV